MPPLICLDAGTTPVNGSVSFNATYSPDFETSALFYVFLTPSRKEKTGKIHSSLFKYWENPFHSICEEQVYFSSGHAHIDVSGRYQDGYSVTLEWDDVCLQGSGTALACPNSELWTEQTRDESTLTISPDFTTTARHWWLSGLLTRFESAKALLSRIRASPPAPRRGGGLKAYDHFCLDYRYTKIQIQIVIITSVFKD
ncbi:hypothetical protein PoB_003646200 [Plakobranchus ocellatus]|uniref:Uncharacterized protein n=1 Tax=Plakobranchus ocellatus TaxID=259542 RepID=A0AAV4ASP6_9GAST|nr:hypothetical protein PoB_003646200 [Plakobranchus ocellatus]